MTASTALVDHDPVYLSPHFSLEELTQSDTGARLRLDNTPPAEVLKVLRNTAVRMEAVRELLGRRVISVNSGYRSPEVNKAVGGAATSAHVLGYAVDFNCWSCGSPLKVCRLIDASNLEFDQLIEEGTWVHISFDPRMRGQVLTKSPKGGYQLGLRK